MKKLLLVGALLLSAIVSQAALPGSRGSSALTGLLGFTQSAVNFGVNYEHRLDSSMGFGGYFLYSGEEKDNGLNKNQTMSFGAMAPAHVLDDNRFDIYLAPGFGITMVKGITPQNDETVFGPSIKTGMLFKISSNVKAGIEYSYFTNWFNDKSGPSAEYTNAALSFGF